MSQYANYKRQVLDTCQDLTRKGYLVGTGGNVSVRIEGEEALAITPSSMDYLSLSEEDICVYNFDKAALEGDHSPSVEMAMHIAVYQNRPDVNAVVHTHQPYASTFTLIDEPIPALFDEQVANLGNCLFLVKVSSCPERAVNLPERQNATTNTPGAAARCAASQLQRRFYKSIPS